MQQGLAGLTAGMRLKDLAAELAKAHKPGAQVGRQLFLDLAAQMLGESGTLPAS